MAQNQQQYQEIEPASAQASEPVSTEERIRTRAYYLWEQATDPKGHPDEYWEQARAEIEKEAANGDGTSKKGVLPTPTSKEKP